MSEDYPSLVDAGAKHDPAFKHVVWGLVAMLAVIFIIAAAFAGLTIPKSQETFDVLKFIGLGVLMLIAVAGIAVASSIGMRNRRDAA
jgi:threonine/homoserine/homoserine lactone efflux protein